MILEIVSVFSFHSYVTEVVLYIGV
jgi:hypothetical protein